MSQICYDIVQSLKKENNHIRALAKLIKTNQTTIARKVKELEQINIIDYKYAGKNKVYFVKDSIEAEEYVKIVEFNLLMELLKKYPRLRKIVVQIKNNKKIQLAILFGSYAKGNTTKESDIDIYIETNSIKIKKEIELIDSEISVKIGDFDKKNLLIKEIVKNHVIIKGVERFYELIR